MTLLGHVTRTKWLIDRYCCSFRMRKKSSVNMFSPIYEIYKDTVCGLKTSFLEAIFKWLVTKVWLGNAQISCATSRTSDGFLSCHDRQKRRQGQISWGVVLRFPLNLVVLFLNFKVLIKVMYVMLCNVMPCYAMLSHLISSHVILSYLVLSCLVLSCLILSHTE